MAENYFGITDTGRQRDNNEDTFIAEALWNGQYVMGCVVDGVGGYEGGEVAAQITRDAILQYFNVPSGDVITMMKEALTIANGKIQQEKQQGKAHKGMACVVTMAVADSNNHKFYYAHVGDTRLYLLRDQSLVKITKDHSFVGFLEDSGRLSEAEAMQHPKRNEINKALGFDAPISQTEDYIETGESPFLPGDMLLLCSDGLSDLVSSKAMSSILLSASTLEDKGRALVKAANEAGGKDNITAVLVKNNLKPLLQKATKPIVLKKRVDENVKQETVSKQEKQEPALAQKKSTGHKAMPVIIILLLLALLAAAAWYFLLRRNKVEESTPTTMQPVQNETEKKIKETMGPLGSNEIVLADSFYSMPIILTDTITVAKDSLHVQGLGTVVIKNDSLYKGPAFFFAPQCKYILLENIKLDGYDVALVSATKNLHLKNVQFTNCRVPLVYQTGFPDNAFVSGKMVDSFQVNTDSLVLKTIKN